MNIGFDLDGVLYPWQESFYEYALLYGITSASYVDFYDKEVPEFGKIMDFNIVRLLDLYDNCVPQLKLMEMLGRMKKLGTIFYVTARPPEARFVTENYLRRYEFPDRENLFFSREKEDVIAQNEIDIFVEDNVNRANAAARFCRSFLVTQTYNRNADLHPEVTRLNTIYELEGRI